jgi:DNA polymerase-1
MSDRPILYLIDGHAVAYREFFAMQNVARRGAVMATRAGEPTGAVRGFAARLLTILEKIQPHYLAVSFDRGLSGRETWYPEYKGNREEMPEDLATQMVRIQQLVEAFNIPVMAIDGYEADDVIGTIVEQAAPQDVLVHIITGDRDILQLLSPNVRVQLPQRGDDDAVFDEAAFREKYGLEPPQLVDLKALWGDTSDNIPGVKGIGEKTATDLLQKFDTLDGIYENLAHISAGNQTKLRDGKDSAYLSQRLATIMRDVPITLDLEACVAQEFDRAKVDELFAELEFQSLRDRLQKLVPSGTQTTSEAQEAIPADQVVKTILVNDEHLLNELVAVLNAASLIVWDVETTGVDPMSADLVGIALSVDGVTGYYVPVGHKGEGAGTLFEEPAAQQLTLTTVIEALRPPLTNPHIPKAAHNATFDLLVMRQHGIDVSPVIFDSMIAEWVNDPISRFLGLKNLVRDRFNITMQEITSLIGSGKKQRTMADVSPELAAPYAAADAALTYQLQLEIPMLRLAKEKNSLRHDLTTTEQIRLFETIEMPLIPVIAEMEQTGVMLDVPFLREMGSQFESELKAREAQIYEQSGGEFNINSTKQLNEVLFDRLKLSVQGLRKTTQGYSVDVNTLDALKDAHEIVPLILEYRELSKLKSTYIDALPELVNKRTERVHTSYNQTGSSTGRFSSSNPNLQNIPIRTEKGREIRRAFIAAPGNVLLSVDYSQIELRVMAHISGDATLQAAFKQWLDIHQATAAAVFGVKPEEVTYEQRSFAKRVNFGLMYGMGAFRLARDSDLTLAEAERFIKTYFSQMPGVDRYIKNTEEQAKNLGYVQTLEGRRRYFPALHRGNLNSQSAQAELRAAINMPIQGTAADILKIAMLRLHRALPDFPGAKMILQVHDELVLEVPEQSLLPVAKLVVETMENAYQLAIPLVANAEYGQNWLNMDKVPSA